MDPRGAPASKRFVKRLARGPRATFPVDVRPSVARTGARFYATGMTVPSSAPTHLSELARDVLDAVVRILGEIRDRDPLHPYTIMYVLLKRLPRDLRDPWIAAHGFPGKNAGRPVSAANVLARLVDEHLVREGEVETIHVLLDRDQVFHLAGRGFGPGARRVRAYRLV